MDSTKGVNRPRELSEVAADLDAAIKEIKAVEADICDLEHRLSEKKLHRGDLAAGIAKLQKEVERSGIGSIPFASHQLVARELKALEEIGRAHV